MTSRLVTIARAVDDTIIDRGLQPGVNLALWHFGIPVYTIARVFVVLGAGVGMIWLHRFDRFASVDFYQDLLSLLIMVGASYLQIRMHEARQPRQDTLLPTVRATGLLWRTAWLVDLLIFPSQWPVEPHGELVFNFIWTALVVLPYWIICCRRLPPPEVRRVGVFAPATITAR